MYLGIVVDREGQDKEIFKVEVEHQDLESVRVKYDELKNKYPEVDLNIISINQPIPPEEEIRATGEKYYCPYCGELREFESVSGHSTLKSCPVCGVSTSEFWVRQYNGWNRFK